MFPNYKGRIFQVKGQSKKVINFFLILSFFIETKNCLLIYKVTVKLLEVVLEEKRREILKEWINSGRIENINDINDK